MSSPTSRDHFNPDDPLYFAPRRLRRGEDFPPPSAPEKSSDRGRSISSASSFDAVVGDAIAESQRPSPNSEIVPEPRALTFEEDQQHSLPSVAARVAAAVVASALLAYFFVVLVPKSLRSEPSKLAVTETPTFVAMAPPVPPAPANPAPDESETLLQKFVQWQRHDVAEQQLGRARRGATRQPRFGRSWTNIRSEEFPVAVVRAPVTSVDRLAGEIISGLANSVASPIDAFAAGFTASRTLACQRRQRRNSSTSSAAKAGRTRACRLDGGTAAVDAGAG